MKPFLAPVVGYLLGSISFAILVVKLRTGRDVRTVGSGNAGATNVMRAAGKAAALITMAGDIGKGVAAVLMARLLTGDPLWITAAGVAAIAGHVFPLYFGFRGGKGVATAAGTFLTIAPIPTAMVVPIFAGVVWATRYVSVASVVTAAALPVSCWLWWGPLASSFGGRFATPKEVAWGAAVVALLVIGKHHENLERLVRGEERKLGEKKEP